MAKTKELAVNFDIEIVEKADKVLRHLTVQSVDSSLLEKMRNPKGFCNFM